MSKQALGKGLSALIAESEPENDKNTFPTGVATLSIAHLTPGNFQPRALFDETALEELAESIRKNGVIQPIVVRSAGLPGRFHIIAGERRWRASQKAGLTEIPAVIRELDDKQALEFALVENIQRQNLTPIEEAEGYKRLLEEFSYTQEQLAENVGKSRSHISNMLRILTLPQEVRDMINQGTLSMGHARTLVNTDDPLTLAQEIVRSNLNVRQAEKFAQGSGKKGGGAKGTPLVSNTNKAPQAANNKDEDLVLLERSLSQSTGLQVNIEDSEEGGQVVIRFNNLAELDRIIQKLSA